MADPQWRMWQMLDGVIPEDQVLTTAEAARRSGYSQDTIQDWIRRGELTASRNPRNQYVISVDALEAILATKPKKRLEPRKGWRQKARSWPGALSRNQICATVIGTLVAAWLSGAFDNIIPRSPTKVEAAVSSVRVTEAQIPLRDFIVDYFDLQDVPTGDHDALRSVLRERDLPDNITDNALRTVGFVVIYDVTFIGLKGRACTVEWSVYDATTGQPLPDSYLRDQLAFPRRELIPTAEEDTVSDQIWIPRPPRAGPFIVKLQIRDDSVVQRRVPLAHAESQPFR